MTAVHPSSEPVKTDADRLAPNLNALLTFKTSALPAEGSYNPEDLKLQKNSRRVRNILHGMSLLYSSGRNVKRDGLAKASGLFKLSVTTERLLIVWSGGKCGKRTRECQVIAGSGRSSRNFCTQKLTCSPKQVHVFPLR